MKRNPHNSPGVFKSYSRAFNIQAEAQKVHSYPNFKQLQLPIAIYSEKEEALSETVFMTSEISESWML